MIHDQEAAPHGRDDFPVSRKPASGLRLAIVGDTHYTNPAYHRTVPPQQADNPTFAAGVARHVRTTREVLPQLLEEVRVAAPDLVVQLGDVVQGHGDDDRGNERELCEALDLLRRIGRPLLFARGTHEGPPGGAADAVYREHYLAEIARTLGQPRTRVATSYVWRGAGCCLLVLDYTTYMRDGPMDQLLQRELDTAARRGERVLVCGHAPLVPIGRPFFSRLEFARTVFDRLAVSPVPVDAYFCGHTHNQVATFHRMGPRHESGDGWWLPQFQSVPVGDPRRSPVPLASVRALLPPPETLRCVWAQLQGASPGWFLVEVSAGGVDVHWRVLGQGADAGRVHWRAAGHPEVLAAPAAPAPVRPPVWPLRAGDDRVRSVWLRAAGVGSRAPHRVVLNGQPLGTLGPLEHFNAEQGLAVPKALWPDLGGENEVIVEPAAAEAHCLGGFVLEVTLGDGSVARSRPSPQLYATATRWDGWRWVTPGLRHVAPTEPLRVQLPFG